MGKWYDLCDNTMGVVKPPCEDEAPRKVGFSCGEEPQVRQFTVIEEEEEVEAQEEISDKNGIYFSNDYISPEEWEKKLADQAEEELIEELVDKLVVSVESEDVTAEEHFLETAEFHDALDESFQQRQDEDLQKVRRYLVCGNWMKGSQFDQYKFLWEMGCILPTGEPLDPNTEIVVAFPSKDAELAKCVMPSYWSAVQIYLNDSQEMSADMTQEAGASWAIIGQGERSIELEENYALIAEKVWKALYDGLKVIVCVGELLEERESGRTLEVLFNQTKAIADIKSDWTNIVLAYEPVWVIGTGEALSPDQVQYIHAELRHWLKENVSDHVANTTRIIYAGSVSSDNCKELVDQEDIDGFLVASSYLQADEFKKIVNINFTG